MKLCPANKAFPAAALMMFLVFLLAASAIAQAQTSERLHEGAQSPGATAGGTPSAPGGTPSSPGGAPAGPGGGPAVNLYLKNLYAWFLGVVGISALFALVFGGVLYMFSGTSLTKVEQAKHWITNAIFGMLLAAGSFVLLRAINPDFVEHGFDLSGSIRSLIPPLASSPAASPQATPSQVDTDNIDLQRPRSLLR